MLKVLWPRIAATPLFIANAATTAIRRCGSAVRFLTHGTSELQSVRQDLNRLAVEIARLFDRMKELDGLALGARPKLIGPTTPHQRFAPILLNTMPKSGSIYLSRLVALTLGVEYSLNAVAYGFFPTYFMIPGALASFSSGNIVRQEHFDASPLNLQICTRYIDRVVLHIRDPRGALLSWAHHVNRFLKLDPTRMDMSSEVIPEGFIDWPFHVQIDWHIERHLVSLVLWLRQWVEAAERRSSPKVLWRTTTNSSMMSEHY